MTTFKEAFEQMDKQDLTVEKKPYLEVKTLEIAGFASVLQALRLPFGLECRSKVFTKQVIDEEGVFGKGIEYGSIIEFDDKDLHLLSTLVKRGDEHSKCLRGLLVYAEINAPRYFWQEMVTYEIGAIKLSSESTMHIQGKGLSTEELVRMKDKLEEGTMQKRIHAFSYQTLRRIYKQRRYHRLPHWHIFCAWIKSLPFAEQLILVELNED
jgi:hypothetical protein